MSKQNQGLARRMLLVALIVFVISALAVQARATYGAQVTADEPQYLLTALSLGEDFDLDISDEIEEERFRDFHQVDLNPQTIALDDEGLKISPHDPLLPLILALPMRIGGWELAKASLGLIAAATAAATIWLAARRLNVGASTATWVVGAMFCAPPLTSYGSQIYPAMPAALCVVLGVAGVTAARSSPGSWLGIAMVVCLPWLGIKYVPLAAVLAATWLWKNRQSPNVTTAFQLLALVAAAFVYLVVHHRIYGSWTVYASGDHFVDGEWLVVGNSPDYPGRTRRLLGLIVDKRFGIAAWAPVYLVLPLVITRTIRRRDQHWQLLVALCVVCWAVATWVALTMHGWWWAGRQVVPVLPLVAVLIAAAVDRHRRRLQAVVVAALLGTLSWLWLVVETSTGQHTLIVDFDRTSNPWYRVWQLVLPDHQVMSVADHVLTAFWAVAVIFGCWWVWRQPGSETATQSTTRAEISDSRR